MQNQKTWIEISRANLIHNLKQFEKIIPRETQLMAVIKANAYGHGLIEIASIFKSRPEVFFGVDSIEEARVVRRIAKNPVMILGYIPETALPDALKAGFHVSVYSRELLGAIPRIVRAYRIPAQRLHIHLKIETGTNRLGISLDELHAAKISISIEGIYTHFADSENMRSDFIHTQIKKLEEARRILEAKHISPHFLHNSCTAAAIRGERSGNLVRIGIGLYGLWPSPELQKQRGQKFKLLPVLSWKTRIAQVKVVHPGETVGYDRTWKATRKTHIAVIPVGYADGYDRGLSDVGSVLIRDARASIIGSVCMNMMMVDLGKLSAREGDEVVLIGTSGKKEITVDDIAKKIGTINYEVVSRINPLISRIVL